VKKPSPNIESKYDQKLTAMYDDPANKRDKLSAHKKQTMHYVIYILCATTDLFLQQVKSVARK
jgi:hypothetical protein